MEKDIKQLLRDEIQNELGELKRMEVGTDEYRTTVDGITKLVDKLDGLENSEFERAEKNASQGMDYDLKVAQLKDEKKDRWIKNGISIGGIVLPLLVAIWGTRASFRFEEEGTITSTLGRGWLNKLIPKK